MHPQRDGFAITVRPGEEFPEGGYAQRIDPTHDSTVTGTTSVPRNSPKGRHTQRVDSTHDSIFPVSPSARGKSPKGIHRLAQGQRATASATLGSGPHPPSFPRRGYIRSDTG